MGRYVVELVVHIFSEKMTHHKVTNRVVSSGLPDIRKVRYPSQIISEEKIPEKPIMTRPKKLG